jgi:hypothetical protein
MRRPPPGTRLTGKVAAEIGLPFDAIRIAVQRGLLPSPREDYRGCLAWTSEEVAIARRSARPLKSPCLGCGRPIWEDLMGTPCSGVPGWPPPVVRPRVGQ